MSQNQKQFWWNRLFPKQTAYDAAAMIKDPRTYTDDMYRALKLGKWFFAAMSLVICVYYHINIFESTWKGIGVAVFFELACVVSATYAFRKLFDKRTYYSLAGSTMLVILVAFSGFAFYKKYEISANGAFFSSNDRKVEIESQKSPFDATFYKTSLSAAQEELSAARRQTWQGRLTPEGISLVKATNAKIARIKSEWREAAQKHDAIQERMALLKSERNTAQTAQKNYYGGICEIAFLIALILQNLVLLEILENNSTEMPRQNAPAPQGQQVFRPAPKGQNPSFDLLENHVAPQSTPTPRNPIGFRPNDAPPPRTPLPPQYEIEIAPTTSIVEPEAAALVPHVAQVAQTPTSGFDADLKLLVESSRRIGIKQFTEEGRDPNSVCKAQKTWLDKIYQIVRKNQNSLSALNAAQFECNRKCSIMREIQKPYDAEEDLMEVFKKAIQSVRA